MKLSLPKTIGNRRKVHTSATPVPPAPHRATRTTVPLCPYTLEPAAWCETRKTSLRHRCSFTLEPCAG
jgi:hypothetical protein